MGGMADIRPYQPRDRQAVHAICRATIYGGTERLRPPDPDLFAELMIRYYTDFTPETVWVAERRGRVVGYLAGCFDEDKLRRAMISRIAPRAVARSLGRGLLLRPPLWRQLAVLPRFLAAERRAEDVDLSAYPAHLHVNLLPEARGRRLGERLVEELFVAATRRGVPGVHATVLEDNRGGRRFFERLGFEPLFRRPVLRPPARRERLDEKIVYVLSLPAD
jgi:ribosomal protein S18 acetylase RimI-like enzyme